MSMLLTISQPTKSEFGGRNTHDFSPQLPYFKSRASPSIKVDSPVTALRASLTDKMSTPHRGLPPPAAMNLPDPNRPPPPSMSQPLGAMPAPPHEWRGQEDSMRNWLAAKAEEDKRKQEEEKTAQERYRLEQRRIEHEMLRDSLQAGVPPQMVPMIYAGIGGANLANVSLDWLQQYATQLQAAQQQQQQIQAASPELRRETRMIGHAPNIYAGQPTQMVPSQPVEQGAQGVPLQTTFSAYQPSGRPPPTSAPRSATHTQLPRLTTNEMYVQQPPQSGPGSAHPLQQSQTIGEQPASSPSIYFHHWVPPNESKGQPQTPAGTSKGDQAPGSAHPGSHLSESDYKESPRKRKAQGGHQPNPPPSAGPQYTSPSFSTTSSTSGRKGGTHQRSRSNASAKESESRPDSRRDPEPPRSSQPDPATQPERFRPAEPPQQQDDRQGRTSTESWRDYPPERPDSRREER